MIAARAALIGAQAAPPPVAYRHFRIHVTKDKGQPYLQYAAVQLLDSSNNPMAWAQSATAYDTPYGYNTHNYGANETPSALLLGLASKKMCCLNPGNPINHYVYIDAGAEIDLSVYTAWRWWTANDNAGRDPISFTLAVSTDKTEWLVVDSATDANIPTARNVVGYVGGITL